MLKIKNTGRLWALFLMAFLIAPQLSLCAQEKMAPGKIFKPFCTSSGPCIKEVGSILPGQKQLTASINTILKHHEITRSLLQAKFVNKPQKGRQNTLLLVVLLLLALVVLLYVKKREKDIENVKLATENELLMLLAKISANIAGENKPVEVFLKEAFDMLLENPAFAYVEKGAIFLSGTDGKLNMVSNKNFSESALKKCASVKKGDCLCGQSFAKKEMVFCDHIDERHSISYDGMKDHGHYIFPVMFHGEVLAVLNLQLKAGHPVSDLEKSFIEKVCKTLALVINTKKKFNAAAEQIETHEKLNQQIFAQKLEAEQKSIEVKQIHEEQERLNQELFAQKLEVEQKNIDSDRYSKKMDELNQKLFAQKLEVEQRKTEIEHLLDEQEKLNQKLFAQSLEVGQRNVEAKKYSSQLQKQKEEVEITYNDLRDSIIYAKSIQTALLPNQEVLDNLLNDHFVLFRPKKTVSGDFYYAKKLMDRVFFAVADCTGHGVPGGFITILGITYLNEVINRKEVKNPAEALSVLRVSIKGIFKQFGTQNQNGLNIALCSIDKEGVLDYSGAFNPLYIIRGDKLIRYKPTRSPVGWYPKEYEFENHQIKLEDGDLIYLYTDGFTDQFGGKNKRKFMRKPFESLLYSNRERPMNQQKEILERAFDDWKSGIEQTDDVTVMGIRWGKRHVAKSM